MTKHLIPCLMFLTLLTTASLPAYALLGSVRVTPPTKEVAVNAPVSFIITWKPNSIGPPVNLTVEADDGVLRIGNAGTVLRNTSGLSKSFTLPPALNGFVSTFTETLTIPRDFILRALKEGEALTYTREFTDDAFATSIFSTVTIVPSSAGAADFDVSRITLTFGDQSVSRSTQIGEKLITLAKLKTSGSGLVRGAWEIREGGVAGNFRTLRNFQQPVSGQQDVTIASPTLPTGDAGRYDVRLRLNNPDVTFEEPFISYYVGNELGEINAKVTAPDPGAPIGNDTLIRWKPVAGAKSYRIEARKLGSDKGRTPAAAMLVDPDKFSARPSPLFMEGLNLGEKYQISVIVVK